jgi:hypothetical protein
MKSRNRDWEVYRLLAEFVQGGHDRWVGNYRVALSFNAFLLPAATALLGYATRGQQDVNLPLLLLVVVLCIVGIVVTVVGLSHMKRIQEDDVLRLKQLRRLEKKKYLGSGMSVRPFKEGKRHFYASGRPRSGFGLRGSSTYGASSWAIVAGYVVIIVVAGALAARWI